MPPLDNSITLELEGPEAPDIPRFETLNRVYEIQLQSLYTLKKRSYKLFTDVGKQILDNRNRQEQEGGQLSQIQPRFLEQLYKAMDEFEENKKTLLNMMKAMTDCLVADINNVDNRMKERF